MESNEVRMSKAELLKAIRTDCVTVFAFYLGEELTMQVPELHEEIWQELLEILESSKNFKGVTRAIKKLFCVPRGHSKTTLIKLAIILFLRYSPLSFIAYASNTIAAAIAAVKDIVEWLGSPQDEELYGPRRDRWIEKSNDTQGLYIFYIQTPDYGEKRCVMKALGVDTQVRGTLLKNRRPEMLIFDDCEDIRTAATEETQKRINGWILGSAMKAVARHAVIIMLGNMVSERSLITKLAKDPSWNPTVFGAIVRNKATGLLEPLWPDLWSLEALIEDYKAHRRLGEGHIWAHEMMNLTSEQIFGMDLENLVDIPMPNPDMLEAGCIVVDPAFGLKGFNDMSALTVHAQIKVGYMGNGIPHVIDSYKERITEEQIFDKLVELSTYWGIKTWCIESIAAQRLFIPLFKSYVIIRKINPDLFYILPISGGAEAKASRIKAFKNSVASGSYGIAESQMDLLNALITYNPESKDQDDLVDSAALGLIAWASHGEIIEANGITQVGMQLFSTENEGRVYDQYHYSPM